MKEILIKYNPYLIKTEITVDGKELRENSKIKELTENEARLQEWIDDLPALLADELNDNIFKINFHGTTMDFEDLKTVFEQFKESGSVPGFLVKVNHIPAKKDSEIQEKINRIDEVFQKLHKGPLPELKNNEQMLNAFELAKGENFEVCVVATMSAGKSTLINAMLGQKLMPSKQEACTAIITRIKDTDGSDKFNAKIYDKFNDLIKSVDGITYEQMASLNSDKNVSEIKIEGDIPFVSSAKSSLVLIDTPGPNNANDKSHFEVQSSFLGKSSKALVLYVIPPEFGTDDDDTLLRRIAESMTVSGKRSRDRFIFVVNKCDNRKKEDGPIENTLDKIRKYLAKHGIEDPQLFPISALSALNIRLLDQDGALDEDETDELATKIRKQNRTHHFEEAASLPQSAKNEITDALREAEDSYNGGDALNNPKTALIHSGVPSLEAAIRQYVEKYAQTAKIKNLVDTFMGTVQQLKTREELKSSIMADESARDELLKKIQLLEDNLKDGNNAKQLETSVEKAADKVDKDSQAVVRSIQKEYQEQLTKRLDLIYDVELSVDEAENELDKLIRYANKLEPYFISDLKEMINDTLTKTAKTAIDNYKMNLKSLAGDTDILIGNIEFDPIKLMAGEIDSSDFSLAASVKSKKVKVGEEWIENTDRKWYKPWTWGQEKGYWRDVMKKQKYVDGSDLGRMFLKPVQEKLIDNGNEAMQYARDEAKKIKNEFDAVFERLNQKLNDILNDLKNCATDLNNKDTMIKENTDKLNWLNDITREVNSILEI